ncbi:MULTISPECIES: ammonium transporter [unclassified Leptospira]|uniref:ammonium transporter n=1 Tax=unclassified Leptospira TaxID=2633828 RepID=UPI0002BE5C9F|nr:MULTISPECIES: ammonium transporter [unclassified Leptospira]EMJ98520.1 ammonium transporter [Leptospira sp. B5-022]MCR1792699.1 ammonium transporter [Leptospira sp. id769339]
MDHVLPAAKELAKNVDILWVIFASALVFFMQAGFLLLESGLVRSKNSINVAIKNLLDYVFGTICFFLIGYGFMYGTSLDGWIGKDLFFLEGLNTGKEFAFFLFQVTFMGTAATIVSGAVAERIRFQAYLVCSIFVSLLIYPVFGHWAWGGGWLSKSGFHDFAGSSVVHSVGAWVALAGVIVLGPRKDRFDSEGKPRELYGHNLPFSVLGTFILWFGWFGFNGGSTLSLTDEVPKIIVNTSLAACSGCSAAILFDYITKGVPHVSGAINGVLGGLVAITAGCDVMSPGASLLTGLIAGVLVEVAAWILENILKVDDVVSAFPVHGVGGIWGTLAVSVFAQEEALRSWNQWQAQLTGVAVCAVWSFSMGLILFFLMKFTISIRVTSEEEERGLNESEHGAKTVWLDLMNAMKYVADSKDLRKRIDVDPGVESGAVAELFNRLLLSLTQIIGVVKENSDKIENESELLENSTLMITKEIEKQKERTILIRETSDLLESSLKAVLDLVREERSRSSEMRRMSEEMSQGMKELQTDILTSGQISESIQSIAFTGERTLERTVKSMQGLNGSAKKVEELVGILQKIAEQLGMLSINAAIESARGGDKGFAVVAEQISVLSEKTASNAKQANKYLKEIWETVNGSLQSLSETVDSFKAILIQIPKLSKTMNDALESVREYSSRSEDLETSIQGVAHMSESVAGDMEKRYSELNRMRDFFCEIEDGAVRIGTLLEDLQKMSLMLSGQTIRMHRVVDIFQIEPNVG